VHPYLLLSSIASLDQFILARSVGASILIEKVSPLSGIDLWSEIFHHHLYYPHGGLHSRLRPRGLILLPMTLSNIGLEDQARQSACKSLEHEETESTISVEDVENNA
jgi:hypothetical protein